MEDNGGFDKSGKTAKPVATNPIPRWLKRMPEKWRKVNNQWIAWQRPSPTKNPTMTNKQRFHANPRRQYGGNGLVPPDPEANRE